MIFVTKFDTWNLMCKLNQKSSNLVGNDQKAQAFVHHPKTLKRKLRSLVLATDAKGPDLSTRIGIDKRLVILGKK